MKTKTYEFSEKKKSKNQEHCGARKLWLEQGYNKHTTNEANDETKRRQNLQIFRKNHENEEHFRATLCLERRFNNNLGVRNRRKTVLKCLFERGATLMW